MSQLEFEWDDPLAFDWHEHLTRVPGPHLNYSVDFEFIEALRRQGLSAIEIYDQVNGEAYACAHAYAERNQLEALAISRLIA